MTSGHDHPWARDLQSKRRDRADSSASMTQLTKRISKASVSDEGDGVPSFIREFESKRKRNAAAGESDLFAIECLKCNCNGLFFQ